MKIRYDRLPEAGLLMVEEMAEKAGISPSGVRARGRKGLIRGGKVADNGQHLYEDIDRMRLYRNEITGIPEEVQYE